MGGASIDLDGYNEIGALEQNFQTKIGQSYRISFYMAGNPDPSPPLKTMEVKSGTFDDIFSYDTSTHGASRESMNYVAETFIFSATSGSTALQFISTDTNNIGRGPVIGDVSVSLIPADSEFQIHAFTGATINSDGAAPTSQLTPNSSGVLFGTTQAGGANSFAGTNGTALSCGTMFSLIPNFDGTAWTEQTLFSFGSQAWFPTGRLTYDRTGDILYGTALYGGGSGCGGAGCGAVYQLTAPTSGVSSTQTILFTFLGAADGGLPNAHLLQDPSTGIIYGTTRQGGTSGCGGIGCGVVFMLTPPVSGSVWTETGLYKFTGGKDGSTPLDINMDASGNIYGATAGGGAFGKGVVFKLTAAAKGPWTETVLRSFRGDRDGAYPASGVVVDKSGNLYGTTSQGGGDRNCTGGCGTVFKLAPPASGAVWAETILYRFRGLNDGQNPEADLIADSTVSNLYGTTAGGGSQNCAGGCGTAFKLTAPASGAGWKETILHRFLGGDDGSVPMAGLHMDSAGKLYGTTVSGGPGNLGTAFQLQ